MRKVRNNTIRNAALVATATLLATCPMMGRTVKQRHAVRTAAHVSEKANAVAAVKTANDVKKKQQIVAELKGLVFVTDQGSVRPEGVASTGVKTSGAPMLDNDEFRDAASAYIGHPLTFEKLDELTRSVVRFYADHHHPLVDAVAPGQSVDSGVIQIVVTEFRVGQVKTEGNRWFSDSVVKQPIKLKPGETVNSAVLLSQIDAANSNPFRQVNLVYQPSSQPGYTDVVLQTQDRFPLRVTTGFDNSGTPVTGRNRWEMGVTWGNALWRDQQISYQFSGSTDFLTGRSHMAGQPGGASFAGHSISWSMPVRGRDSISVFGSYDRSVPNLGTDFGMVGLSGQASFRYSLALPRTTSFVQTVQGGYDFKTTNNNLNFGGTQVSRTNAEIGQFPITYAGNLTDRHGSTAVTTSAVFSPGRMTPNNNASAFQPADGQAGRALASPRYVYWRTDANRLTKLPMGSVWSLRVVGQESSGNLLYTEQLAGGGSEILRGYDPNAILGDRGAVVSNELRSPVFQKRSGEAALLGQVQVLGFWDWAHLSAVHPVEDAVNHLNASSAGMGLRYSLRSNVTAKFDYGWQLQHLTGAGSRDHLLSFSLLTSY